MLCMVKMPLKGEVEGCALNSHGNYIVDHGKSRENHGIVFLNFCGNPASGIRKKQSERASLNREKILLITVNVLKFQTLFCFFSQMLVIRAGN